MDSLKKFISGKKQLDALSLEEKALFFQYLEFKLQHFDRVQSKDDEKILLKELNQQLSRRVFLAATRLTAIDLLYVEMLAPILNCLNYQELEQYPCVCRWFQHISLIASQAHLKTVEPIKFQRISLYSNGRMDFRNKNILAPMVRVSLLPMRLLALRYGADLVYGEEVIDHKILQSKRVVNDILGTVDFILPDGSISFRTCSDEKDRFVFQLGTSDPDRALKVAKILEQDIGAIDINMGCPKEYSIKGGMGAALLSHPDKIEAILTTLTANLKIPVTCKIRVLPELSDTLSLLDMISKTGVAAVAIHGRTRHERPQDRNRDEIIASAVKSVNIPVIANGGSRDSLHRHEDLDFFRHSTGASSVMVARSAMHNPAIFIPPSDTRPPPTVPVIVRDFLRLAVRYDSYISTVKYCIQQILHEHTDCRQYRPTLAALDVEMVCKVWDLTECYNEEIQRRLKLSVQVQGKRHVDSDSFVCPLKRLKGYGVDDEDIEIIDDLTVRGNFRFYKRFYGNGDTSPKQILYELCKTKTWKPPKFDPCYDSSTRLYSASVVVNDVKYSNSSGDKNKKYSEQAIACICLKHLGVSDGVTPSKCSAPSNDITSSGDGNNS